MTIPLGVLDLVPVSSGSTPPQAVANSIDLARAAERFGYTRYWVAEHHLNPGVVGSSPAVVLALLGQATTNIRLGSGAVQLGHRTSLSTVEEFGLLDAAYGARIDLGLGRSGGSRAPGSRDASASFPSDERINEDRLTPLGLKIPKVDFGWLFKEILASPRFAAQRRLLQQTGAESAPYTDQVTEIVALLDGSYRSPEGVEFVVAPGNSIELWVLGSSAGESAEVAGALGKRFAANYHVSPASVLQAVDAYRAAFVPSAELERPYVSVSADVVVAETAERARELAAGYAPWVRSIRKAEGAIAFPTPQEAAAYEWNEQDRELVSDRVETQFVGTAAQVADQLAILAQETAADELLITTITHDHADRVRSYELLATEWAARPAPATAQVTAQVEVAR